MEICDYSLICNTCWSTIEEHFNFKSKCIFTEDYISPYVENKVQINLKDIQNPAVKLEKDQNVCRLCLESTNDNNEFNCDEKKQFQKYFPEMVSFLQRLLLLLKNNSKRQLYGSDC